MNIGVPKETFKGETRVALVPGSVAKLVKLGAEVQVEKGLGALAGFSDDEYKEAGAKVTTRKSVLTSSDVVVRVRKPDLNEIEHLKKDSFHISFLDPFNETDLIDAMAKSGVNAVSMEMIPRTTYAQKMDALSSQASLGGYVAVILAAERLNKILPMMTTPSGTIKPATVFIVGVGVAGLQAIATAKRLGAKVIAFDVRAEVKEQVESLGGKFVEIDVGAESTSDGYAKQLTEEQLKKQKEGMLAVYGESDVIITTAQVFGRKAPVLIEEEALAAMRPGTVVVDMAVENGGNVAGSQLDKEVDVNGVNVVGLGNLPGRVARNASEMYSANIFNLISDYYDGESNSFKHDLENEILKGCLITYRGEVVNERLKQYAS